MKHLTTITTMTLLILAAGVLAAEKPLSPDPPSVPQQVPLLMNQSSSTFLKLDPLLVELSNVLKTMRVREDALLVELLQATDEEQTAILIRRIERLDTDRELALLKVQARFARLDGRFDLEREIKGKILKILNEERIVIN